MYTLITPDESPVVEIDNNEGTIKNKFTEQEIIDYVNTVYYYDLKDNDMEDIRDFETAVNCLIKDNYVIYKVD